MLTLTIIGLGRLGTSLGLALKRRQDVEIKIIGHDLHLEISKEAEKQGALDKAEWNLPASCETADVIFLCVPFSAVREVMTQVAPLMKEGAILVDTSMIKAPVMEWAVELLQTDRHFVGAAPALSPKSLYDGSDEAHAELFDDGVWALMPGAAASPDAVKIVGGLVYLVGAVPFYIGADEYDALSSSVNTLPALLAASLTLATGRASAWIDSRKIADRNFATTTSSVSLINPDSLASLLTHNRANTLRDLEALMTYMKSLRELIATSDEAKISSVLNDAAKIRNEWIEKRSAANWAADEVTRPEMPRMSDMFKQMIGMGGKKKNS